MKKKLPLNKSEIAFLLAAAILSAPLSGCQYESFDDYLRALGMKDPVSYEEELVDEAPMVASVSEDTKKPEIEYVDISEYTDVPPPVTLPAPPIERIPLFSTLSIGRMVLIPSPIA